MGYVSVLKAFSSGEQVNIQLRDGDTVGSVASRVGAPSGVIYRLNGASAKAEQPVGNGDTLIINVGKVAAG